MKEYMSKWGYKVIRSFRKSMCLQIRNWNIIIKVPYLITKKTVEIFIDKHHYWIDKKLGWIRKSIIDLNKIDIYKKDAKDYIPSRVKEIALNNFLKYNKIKITNARTRWWSCTSYKNLNFSYRLILTPKEVIDYVIVHELAHLKHMNHSKKFWNEVEKMMPDYKKYNKWLKDNNDLFYNI